MSRNAHPCFFFFFISNVNVSPATALNILKFWIRSPPLRAYPSKRGASCGQFTHFCPSCVEFNVLFQSQQPCWLISTRPCFRKHRSVCWAHGSQDFLKPPSSKTLVSICPYTALGRFAVVTRAAKQPLHLVPRSMKLFGMTTGFLCN